MAKMTADSAVYAYEQGKLFYIGQISLKQAKEALIKSKSFDKESSAADYLYAFRAMREGECYKRNINAQTTEYYLENILKDYGVDELSKALQALLLHIEYYEAEAKVSRKRFREIYSEFSDKVRHPIKYPGAQAFSDKHKEKFNAIKGAFSTVTKQESRKQQITITGEEKKLFEEFYGEKIFWGIRENNPEAATKRFNLYGSERQVELTTLYRPRKGKNELQLYTSEQAGFAPKAGDIWFAFERDGEKQLYIGYMSPEEWEAINNLLQNTDYLQDDELYQQAVHASPAAAKQLSVQLKFPRDPKIAREVLEQQEWKCEIDNAHTTFISKATGKPYTEAHHLIPMGTGDNFTVSLDTHANIIGLCPNCHRLLHHGSHTDVGGHLKTLLDKRRTALVQAGIDITAEQLLTIYFPSIKMPDC